jgi:PAS domain S-box-containing protein
MRGKSVDYPLLLLAVLLFAVVLGAGALGVVYLGDKARRDILRENETAISIAATQFLEEADKLHMVTDVLSKSPEIEAALRSPSPAALARANASLDMHNSTVKASVSYLINASGICVASSNRNTQQSFVGTNYSFRDYFRRAIEGGSGYAVARGIRTHKMGFFSSCPVRAADGRILGVAAIKENVAQMGVDLARYRNLFFVDKDGVIFYSARPELERSTVWPLPQGLRGALLASRQFGDTLYGALLPERFADGAVVHYRGRECIASIKPLVADFSIVAFGDTERIWLYRLAGVLVTLFFCALLALPLSITARSSAALWRERERLMEVIDFLPDAAFVIDADGRVAAWNRAMAEFTGVPADDMLGKGDYEYALALYGRRRPVMIDLAMSGAEPPDEYKPYLRREGDILHREGVLRLPSGREFYGIARSAPLYDEKGRVSGAIETFLDLSARRRAEEALRESEEHFRALAENSADVIMRFDRAKRHIYVSPGVERETGIPRDQFIGRTHLELGFPREFCDMLDAELEKVFAEGRVHHMEFMLPSGIWIDMLLMPEFDKARESVRYVLTFARDITLLKRGSERLRRINACLLGLGADYDDNIARLTALCGEMLGAAQTFYSTLSGGKMALRCGWRVPRDAGDALALAGHMFYDGVLRDGIFSNSGLDTDPHMAATARALGAKAYMGHCVRCGNAVTGALNAVFARPFAPTQEERQIMGILSAAIGTEELRRRAEADLSAEKERLGVTLRSIADGVIVTDSNGRVTLVNSVAEEAAGWKEAEAVGRPLSEVFRLVSDKTRLPLENPVTQVLREGRLAALYGHSALVARDGSLRAVENSGAPILDGAGKILGVVLVFRDVTRERRQRDINDKFSYMAEMTSDWLWEVNAHAVYTYVSPKTREALGYGESEILGKPMFELMPPDEALRVEPQVRECMRLHKALFLPDNVHLHKDGREVVFETSAVPFFDEDGLLCGYRGIGRDITERRKKDEMLRRLEIDNKSTAEAARAKAAFLAGISGELRTPLNRMLVSCEALGRDLSAEPDASRKESIEGIVRNGRHLLALISDMLALSRLESDRMEVRPSSLNVREKISAAAAGLRASAPESLAVLSELDGALDALFVLDGEKLERVLANLLSNAAKFTAAGGSVKLSAQRAGMPGIKAENPSVAQELARLNPGLDSYLLVSVADSGIGINQGDLEKLFKPFSQLDASASGNREGAGLGLALCRRFVELLGGRIWAHSVPGRGSVFSFAIPLHPAEK